MSDERRGWRARLAPLSRIARRDPHMVLGFRSFAGDGRLLVRGRALQDEGVRPAAESDSLWRNLVNSYRRIEADPLPHARVRATAGRVSKEIETDDEGFFHAWLDLDPALATGAEEWIPLSLELLAPRRPGSAPITGTTTALVLPRTARFIVISDMDDTVLQSHVSSAMQAVRTALLGNARTRLPFPGVAAFYQALRAGASGSERNPVFYVSSSPWNLYDLLVDFLDHQRIPAGPLTLRDWDVERRALGSGRLHGFKDVAIREILDTYPTLPVILVGDTTQRDPEIYGAVVRDYPDRVLAVYVRDVNRMPARRAAVVELAEVVRAARSVLVLADDTLAAARHAADRGLIDPASLAAIQGDKRMDEASAPGKTGPPVVEAGAPTNAPTVIDAERGPLGSTNDAGEKL